MKWRRREKGSYIAQSNGQRIAIVNMKGDGPNAPAWQGPVPAWEVRIGGSGDYDIGAKTLGQHWTLAGAKGWVAEHHEGFAS